MTKKLIAMLLIIFMIVPVLAACGDNSGSNDNDDAGSTKAPSGNNNLIASDDPLVPEIDEHISQLAEDNNFDGKTFTYIGSGADKPTADEVTGDIQSDALYYRQRDIEDLFGVTWSNYIPEETEANQYNDRVAEAIKEDVLAGSGVYDAGYGMTHTCHALLANDMLKDVTEFSNVDLDREWWTSTLRETFTLNDALYLLNGPIVSYYYQDAYSIVFNKQVAEDYGVEAPYDLVKSGEWTFDKMFEIAEAIPSNENNSGAYRFGDPNAIATVLAHDMAVVKYDENGDPYVEDSVSAALSDLADKFCAIYGDDTLTAQTKGDLTGVHESSEEKYGYENFADMFADDKILFLFIPIDEAAWLRVQDVEFGILPMPKGSATQEDYVSYSTSRSAFHVYVPKTTKDPVMTDVILEAMAALGYKYLKPAYYEKILKGRATYDEESQEMVDIIFRTKKYDLIDMLDIGVSINGPGDMVRLYNGAIEESSDGFTSSYFMKSIMVNAQIQELLTTIEANK